MYSTNNEGKSVIAERIIRTLKNKIYKYMASVSKNVYIDKLDNIVKKHNNTYHTLFNNNTFFIYYVIVFIFVCKCAVCIWVYTVTVTFLKEPHFKLT